MKNLKKSLLVLVLSFLFLLLPLGLSFSDDLSEMTDLELLQEWEKILNERDKNSTEKEQILNDKELSLEMKEQSLNEKEKSINEKDIWLQEKEQYYKNLKDDNNNNFWNGFLLGSGVGIFVGSVGGLYLGIKIKL